MTSRVRLPSSVTKNLLAGHLPAFTKRLTKEGLVIKEEQIETLKDDIDLDILNLQ